MLKAMMIITMVSGATYEVKLPTMEQCMAQRSPVESQSDVTSAACIPRTDEITPRELFNRWLDLVLQLQEQRQWPCDQQDSWKPGEDYIPPLER